MKRLLEMIEQVKSQDQIAVVVESQITDRVKKEVPKLPSAFKTSMFFHFLEHCQPFVFSSKHDGPVELEEEPHDDENFVEPKVDAPFKVWSAEMAGAKYISVPKDNDGFDIVSIIAFMAVEQAPGEFFFFTYVEYPNGDGSKRFRREVLIMVSLYGIAGELVGRLYREKTGVETGRTKVKVGTGKDKKHIRINRAIHIMPKRLASSSPRSESGAEIDWSHRWRVRGHWVDLGEGRIGKDREGNYCVPGSTWRSEYVKGPDDKPLIDKQRIVQGDQ